ncbi:SdpI family protein [Hyphomonas pacifica]|uniref:DUF1648 domain-containing protein n=1 Tax=Hyphomonas pacifica TaxID=1280941 RepID=A0A062TSR3_9PROT|nr:SdpI family protein [Hyphomonas pacifica]KCZ50896.1 hypothetical protein HY2_12880 [Hyphomonas pacifica]RAN33471.1 hypothetical protein HY3_13040 [Hyphomonas pacifica]
MKPYVQTGLAWSAGATLVACGISLVASSQLPDSTQIPIHWGADGSPDKFADREGATFMLWMMPAISAFIATCMAIAATVDPRQANLSASRKAYLICWIGAMIVLTGIHAGIAFMMTRTGAPSSGSPEMIRWIIAACGALFILIGNYLPKTRSTFMMGIRTPWTLSSDMTWEKTHRLAGRLFMLAGALGIIGAFVFNGIWLALQLSVLAIGATLISVIYSWFVWRTATDREEGSGYIV